jgi:hypothetical protein
MNAATLAPPEHDLADGISIGAGTPAPEFDRFPKIGRLYRTVVVTEKIDGTNAAVGVLDDGRVYAQSRSRLIAPGKSTDNFGFAAWVADHADELRDGLGVGLHFGEWWGLGIQRGYGLEDRRFSLFNTDRWLDVDVRPGCCDVVPVLFIGTYREGCVGDALNHLELNGSVAAPGFDSPEGVVVFHTAARTMFKATLDGDQKGAGHGA